MTFDEPNKLVTEGIYKITRNPMYLGFVLLLIGVAVILGSASVFSIVIIFSIITDLWYIRYEERALEKKFGSAYDTYKSKVRRWI